MRRRTHRNSASAPDHGLELEEEVLDVHRRQMGRFSVSIQTINYRRDSSGLSLSTTSGISP
jgi:hypothetical protein